MKTNRTPAMQEPCKAYGLLTPDYPLRGEAIDARLTATQQTKLDFRRGDDKQTDVVLKRLAVTNVCSEHELLAAGVPYEAVADWFDSVVGNKIGDHYSDLLPSVSFEVCELYENTPLSDALQSSFDFAYCVWHKAKDSMR